MFSGRHSHRGKSQSPEVALKYLAPYTHRVAISDRRLLSSDDAQGGQQREMTLNALEFLRRFLLPVACC